MQHRTMPQFIRISLVNLSIKALYQKEINDGVQAIIQAQVKRYFNNISKLEAQTNSLTKLFKTVIYREDYHDNVHYYIGKNSQDINCFCCNAQ